MEAGDVLGFYVDSRGDAPESSAAGPPSISSLGEPVNLPPTFRRIHGYVHASGRTFSSTSRRSSARRRQRRLRRRDQDRCPTAPPRRTTAPRPTPDHQGPQGQDQEQVRDVRVLVLEPGSTFQCWSTGGAFDACSSPFTVKAKKGRHTFRFGRPTRPGTPTASRDRRLEDQEEEAKEVAPGATPRGKRPKSPPFSPEALLLQTRRPRRLPLCCGRPAPARTAPPRT